MNRWTRTGAGQFPLKSSRAFSPRTKTSPRVSHFSRQERSGRSCIARQDVCPAVKLDPHRSLTVYR